MSEIQAEHEYYHRLFELAPDGHLITDCRGVIHEVNQAARALLGGDDSSLRGQSLADFVAESGRSSFQEGMLRLDEQPDVDLLREWQVRLQPLQGQPFDAALTVAVLRHPAASAAVLHWALRNISPRKALEESLRKSEARLLAILNTAFNGILLISEQGTIESFNPAAQRIFGFTAAEIIGQNVALLWPFSAEPVHGPSPAGVRPVGEELAQEVVGRRRDGTPFPLEVSLGEVRLDDRRFITATVRDISQRRQVEEALRDRESQFRSLVEVVECLIVILRPDMTILYFNRFAEKETGYQAEEVIGKNYLELFVPDASLREQFRETIGRALVGPPAQLEHVVCCKSGLSHNVIWNTQRLGRYEDGVAILAVGLDITKVKEAQDRALQAERLAAVGEMVAGLAHESGNALQRAQSGLERLALRAHGQPESEYLISEIQRAQNHLHSLYAQVRTYAAPLQLELHLCNLATVWRQAWTDLEYLRHGRQAVLKEQIDCPDTSCVADAFRLEQVFRNIFENSLAACGDVVEIEVHCFESEIDGQPAVGLSICDNGSGLSAEQRAKIFEPFYTTKTKGTGLGMAIAKRIVDAHGGRIAVGDQCPGTDIVITLPWRKP